MKDLNINTTSHTPTQTHIQRQTLTKTYTNTLTHAHIHTHTHTLANITKIDRLNINFKMVSEWLFIVVYVMCRAKFTTINFPRKSYPFQLPIDNVLSVAHMLFYFKIYRNIFNILPRVKSRIETRTQLFQSLLLHDLKKQQLQNLYVFCCALTHLN